MTAGPEPRRLIQLLISHPAPRRTSVTARSAASTRS